MIKVYKIRIGEKVYEVEVEAVSEKEGKIASESSVEKEKKETVKAPSGESTEVKAPMQGLILSVEVTEGQEVKAGETLVLLEAMKMENPIVAPKDGTVSGVFASKGDTVETGDLLITLA